MLLDSCHSCCYCTWAAKRKSMRRCDSPAEGLQGALSGYSSEELSACTVPLQDKQYNQSELLSHNCICRGKLLFLDVPLALLIPQNPHNSWKVEHSWKCNIKLLATHPGMKLICISICTILFTVFCVISSQFKFFAVKIFLLLPSCCITCVSLLNYLTTGRTIFNREKLGKEM